MKALYEPQGNVRHDAERTHEGQAYRAPVEPAFCASNSEWKVGAPPGCDPRSAFPTGGAGPEQVAE